MNLFARTEHRRAPAGLGRSTLDVVRDRALSDVEVARRTGLSREAVALLRVRHGVLPPPRLGAASAGSHRVTRHNLPLGAGRLIAGAAALIGSILHSSKHLRDPGPAGLAGHDGCPRELPEPAPNPQTDSTNE